MNEKAPFAMCEVGAQRRHIYRHVFKVGGEAQGDQSWSTIIICRWMHRLYDASVLNEVDLDSCSLTLLGKLLRRVFHVLLAV